MEDSKRSNNFPIKGFKEGLLVTLGDGEWEEIEELLLAQIDDKSTFFNGAKIALEMGERTLHAAEMANLRDELLDRNVKLFAILSNSRVTDVNTASLGLQTRKSVLKDKSSEIGAASLDGEPAILINKTVRSGTSIKYAGHVVINGDVNPGGEIISTGSILIWGKLRGSAHAGIDGSESEVVCAMEFDPTQLRIANYSLKISKFNRKIKKKPMKISIEEENLVYDYWEKN